MAQELVRAFQKHKKQYEELEYRLLFYGGMSIPNEIYSINVPISDDSWIHQITCGISQKHLVLLHGYGGSSLTYIRLFKQLAQHYTVHALDFLGMGLSHRREFKDEWTREEVVDYFIDAIQEWRKQRKINKMTLAGHSFGGYIASCYAYKYVPMIERLILISPAGTKSGSQDTIEQQYEKMYNESSCGRRILLSILKRVIKCKPTPSSVLNWCCIGPLVIDRALTGRLRLENQQKIGWTDYMQTLSKISPNSQKAFWKLFFMPGVSTPNSISAMYLETAVPFKIQFYFGDSDWMQKQAAYKMSKNPSKINRISYTIIPDSGHQILFDNPELMADYLI